jgi:hypothetical protein
LGLIFDLFWADFNWIEADLGLKLGLILYLVWADFVLGLG